MSIMFGLNLDNVKGKRYKVGKVNKKIGEGMFECSTKDFSVYHVVYHVGAMEGF